MKPAADEEEYESSLEAELRSELELTRIVRRGRTAEEPTVVGTLAERVNGIEERRCRAFVEPVEHIEDLTDQIKPESFAKSDGTRQTHVDRREAMSGTHVAPEASSCELAVNDQRSTSGSSRNAESSV